MRRTTSVVTWSLACCLSFAGFMHSAQAAVIGTEQVLAAEAPATGSAAQARLLATLQRADVSAALQARGVDLAQAEARVNALSDAEAQQVLERIDADPAGASDFLGTVVFIFLVLLVTDILGFTKVFPFTRSIR